MKWIAIKNNGVASLDALTLIGGTNKKEVAGKIGLFGTGFKEMLAAASRNAVSVVVTLGDDIIKFDTDIRDLGLRSVEVLRYKLNSGRFTSLNLSTEFGCEDWRDDIERGQDVYWMMFREVVSNALDEGSLSIRVVDRIDKTPGQTCVYLSDHPRFRTIVRDLDTYFLKPEDTEGTITHVGRMFRSNNRIYSKGVFVKRVSNLGFSYDFKNLRLTESRTVDVCELNTQISRVITALDPVGLSEMLKTVRNNPACYEANLTYYELCIDKDKAATAWASAFGAKSVITETGWPVEIIHRVNQMGYAIIVMPSGWARELAGKGIMSVLNLLSKEELEGSRVIPLSMARERVPYLASLVDSAIGSVNEWFGVPTPPISFYEKPGESNKLGYTNNTGIFINVDHPEDRRQVLQTLLEEYTHWITKAGDGDVKMVEFLTRSISGFLS